MLIVVRHGRTNLNEDGKEKMRGWLPVPLTVEGMQQSAETAVDLAELKGDVYALYTSELVRAVQSATEVAQVLEMEIEPRKELMDWDTGDLAGESVESNLPLIHYHIDHPTKALPGGESYQDVLDRAVPFLKELVESEEICIAVTHNRIVTLLKALTGSKGEKPDPKILKAKAPIEPSGIMMVNSDWKIVYASPKDPEKD